MKKSDLQTGMYILTRNNILYLVLKNPTIDEICEDSGLSFAYVGGGVFLSDDYGENLNNSFANKHDIMEIFVCKREFTLESDIKELKSIWEREE